jgi:hypothetical protein
MSSRSSRKNACATVTTIRDVPILETCGKDWSERTKRLAARIPSLEIFPQGLVERLERGWRISRAAMSWPLIESTTGSIGRDP